MVLFAWTLLNGPLFGGIWAAFNARRLKPGASTAPYYLMGVVGQVFPWVVNRLVLHVPQAHPAAISWVFVFNVIAAYYYLNVQREAYWAHQDSGGQRARLFWPNVVGMLVFVATLLLRVLSAGG